MRTEYGQPVVRIPEGVATFAKDLPPLRGGRDSHNVSRGSGNPRDLPHDLPKALNSTNLLGGGRVWKGSTDRDKFGPYNPSANKPK